MLAVFEKAIGKPPEELNIPITDRKIPQNRSELAEIFSSSWPEAIIYSLPNGNFMALSHANEEPMQPRSIVVMEDVVCLFIGNLENICELRRHYGLPRQSMEAMLVIEVYKVLRDRAPYPSDQVIRDLAGKFAFILFDAKDGTLFTSRDREGGINFQWGVTKDESLVFSDDRGIMTNACGNAFAPFPTGCIFLNGSGLQSFDQPLHKVRAITRVDDQGHACGVMFQVDRYARMKSIPRVGSASNWSGPTTIDEELEVE